jgi:hypothetical protein
MNKERTHAAQPPVPSDIELMMFYDGELDEPRKSEVAAFVLADLPARSKLAGLGLASALVQEQARALTAADDIADLVMAKIEGTVADQAVPAPLPIVAPRSAMVAPAANDNGRRILIGLTALVAAAAAVFAVWSRQPSGPTGSGAQRPVAVQTAPQMGVTAPQSPTGPAVQRGAPEIDVAAVAPEPDSEHGVEVAAVNFGAHMGSIFYVPSGSIEAKHTTTVVWLADDAGE